MRQSDMPTGETLSENTEGAARAQVAQLLRHLAPLLPVVAAATKTDSGRVAWVHAWARQIQLAGMTRQQIERGISRLHLVPMNVPFGWPVFVSLCMDDEQARIELDAEIGRASCRERV